MKAALPALFAALLLALPLRAQQAAVTEQDPERLAQEREAARKLEALRVELRALAAERETTRGERSSETTALREADLALGEVARELGAIDTALAAGAKRQDELQEQEQILQTRLEAQRDALSALLRSAYLLGRHGELRMVFAPDEVAEMARLLAYHRYLQRDRTERIAAIAADLLALAQVRRELQQTRTELAARQAERVQQQQVLDTERERRKLALQGIELRLKQQGARLAALGKDERGLLELLGRLRDAIADIPKVIAGSEPFATRRGRLSWPIAGTVLARFGGHGPDGRVQEGMLIGADAGARVQSVGYGRVAYADWLKGYGMLVIVDHGDGWMTLYAHNEALLKDVGEWVAAGEAIATAGASGGSSDTGVYFELRKDGRPQDPSAWLAKR